MPPTIPTFRGDYLLKQTLTSVHYINDFIASAMNPIKILSNGSGPNPQFKYLTRISQISNISGLNVEMMEYITRWRKFTSHIPKQME